MAEIVIVGGGFAGVWAAASAARLRSRAGLTTSELSILLVAPDPDMVIRPRLYEARPGDMRIPLRHMLDPIEVEHLRATATEMDTTEHALVATTASGQRHIEPYERLILATGSQLAIPPLPGYDHLYNVDTLGAAITLEEHLAALPAQDSRPGRFTAVVVGAGFTGLEVATELVSRLEALAGVQDAADDVRVVLIERAAVVGPELGEGPRAVIEEALSKLRIELRLQATVSDVGPHHVRLSDGTTIDASTTIWTAGMKPSPMTKHIPGMVDRIGRLHVESTLRVRGIDTVFAAGDVAAVAVENEHLAMQSCQHAHAMGKLVGYNAVASLLDLPLDDFAPHPYVTCLDLGQAGAVYTSGWERTVLHTGTVAKDIKRSINRLIYPPVDADDILRAAAHHPSPPTASRADRQPPDASVVTVGHTQVPARHSSPGAG